MVTEALKFAIDVFGVGLLEELADEAWQVACDLFDLPALIWAVLLAMMGG